MIHEIAEIEVLAGSEEAFEAGVAAAAPHFRAAKGCRSLKLERSIENPGRYRLVVGWDSVEDHLVTFRESDGFKQWRDLAGPYFASPPRVEHVVTVLNAF
ncbi:MAG: Antibiotic biosynthesis monooxygenase [Novosphingobium lindaniclasticum]|jgi:quinol monooxygenase YgiN|uniref:putative quinol monooxygenase n=1 Tax=Novosphingobium lindaniclasticum TaxID=1329895 RepID=UPI00240A2CAF|nr:antibiotic biosynthesis monooxygenase [Novosphingobium lindaniclasticum]MDF2640356.1 Antibiotic biosynthesis monooxygenase [Novosphingobium lindaniclasticum]